MPGHIKRGIPLPGHRLFVVALSVVGPHLSFVIDGWLQVRQPRGQLGPAWGETAVLAYQVRQGTEAVPSLVEVPESQPASRVFRPDGQLLGFGLQPPQV